MVQETLRYNVMYITTSIQARRREMMRQDRMEEEARQKDLDAEYEVLSSGLSSYH